MGDELPIRLLFDAVEAGRMALRERDERDIPARLRAVAASSSRSLPPPLAKRLLSELDADDALRAEAADQLSAGAGQASVLYLERSEGWEAEFDTLIADHSSRLRSRSANRDLRRIADLERELKTARAKTRDAQKRAEAAESEAESRIADARRDIKKAGRAAARRADELAAELARSEAVRERLAAELAQVQQEFASLRAQRRKKNRETESTADRPAAGPAAVSMAQALDDLLVRAQQHHEPRQMAMERTESLNLPPGIAPDRADAVEWLLGSGLPQVWIVDGHNLAHRLDPARFTDPGLRNEVAEVFVRIRRQSLGPLRAIIVFDTGAPVGDVVKAAPGVELQFVGDADAEVIDLAGVHGGGAVVVSSDREVRHRAAENGAAVIWSEAVVEYLRG